jgi:hypothetical protein
MTRMADIVFIHTSPVHVATFDALLKEVAPQRRAVHIVREDLLAQAQRVGIRDAGLAAEVQAALKRAAGDGGVVVCTCSTLGGLAESTGAVEGVPVTRIDRAMADQAVQRGAPVLMVAALQSTLQPTETLLRSSAHRLGLPLVLRSLWVEPAWPHFEAGRHDDYIAAIVTAVRAAVQAGETVVLAQASMAPAAEHLVQLGITTLTSPRLGVAHAVGLCATPPGL